MSALTESTWVMSNDDFAPRKAKLLTVICPPPGSSWAPTGWSSCCETAAWPGRWKISWWPRSVAWTSRWKGRCFLGRRPRKATTKSQMKWTPRKRAKGRRRARSQTWRGTRPAGTNRSCEWKRLTRPQVWTFISLVRRQSVQSMGFWELMNWFGGFEMKP